MRAKRAAEPGTDYPLWVARYHAALLAQDSTAAERWRARLPSPPPLLTFPCSWLPWYARYDRTRHRFACEPTTGEP